MSGKLRIQVKKLPMRDLFKIKEAIGRSLLSEVGQHGPGAIDEQLLAALIWVGRLKTEPELSFDTVFSTLDLEAIGEIELDFGGDAESPLAPSAGLPKKTTRSRP